MIVNVDEAGGEDESFCVDDLVAGLGLEICADGYDAIAGDANVRLAERGTGAVGDLGVEDEDGGGSVLRACARCEKNRNSE